MHLRLAAPPPTGRDKEGPQSSAHDVPHGEAERAEATQYRRDDGERHQASKYRACPMKDQVLPEGPPTHPRPLLIIKQPSPEGSLAHPHPLLHQVMTHKPAVQRPISNL